jgi:two-component system, NtrC family, sensor kinase
MGYTWSLRAKIVGLTLAVVLPVMMTVTALTVRLSRGALEDDARQSGLALARELAASAATRQRASKEGLLQQELRTVLGRGSVVRDAIIYSVGAQGLEVRAGSGRMRPPEPEEDIAAHEGQEVAVLVRDVGTRAWRVTVPVWEDKRSVGAVSLTLPLERSDALAHRIEVYAVLLGAATVILLAATLSAFMSRALATPLVQILRVMERAEGGDLAVRAPMDRQDEVGRVARGLNHMLERIASFHAELAHRVSEATARLRVTNERLYAVQQQVTRSERLAAAGELAAAMAHNVGTPLTGVSGHLQLLEEEVADPAVKERLSRIQGQVDRAVHAARQFLDAARPAVSRVPVDLTALLEDLLVLTSPESQRKGILVESALANGLPPLSADPQQLQELFLNLITNALDAMRPGGVLGVTAAPSQSEHGEPSVHVAVSDTGPGMSPELLAQVFEPFFTTRAAAGGTGLGLAIARRITQDHGGSLRLESEPGRGTRAIVTLPARKD